MLKSGSWIEYLLFELSADMNKVVCNFCKAHFEEAVLGILSDYTVYLTSLGMLCFFLLLCIINQLLL